MLNGLEETTFLQIFNRTVLPEYALRKESIVFVTRRADSFGDGANNLAEIASQMVMLRMVKKLEKFR